MLDWSRSVGRMRMWPAAAAAAVFAALLPATTGAAQTPQARFAGGPDRARNVTCIPGFKRVYGIDPPSVFIPRTVADAGVQALDDGVAEGGGVVSLKPPLSPPGNLGCADA